MTVKLLPEERKLLNLTNRQDMQRADQGAQSFFPALSSFPAHDDPSFDVDLADYLMPVLS